MIALRAAPAITPFVSAVGQRLDGSTLAIMLDIDGTLSPIAPTPETATVPPETRDAVRRLTELPGVHVALVSGRSATDALRMTRVEGAWIIGNHGLELRSPHGDPTAADAARAYEATIAQAASALTPVARSTPGAILEDKRWTLSLHFRLVAEDEVAVLTTHARDVAQTLGLRVTEGKKVIELRPPIEINKGTAALDFARRIGALATGGSMMYAGDDQTDEDAFRAIRAHGPLGVTVRILGGADDQSVSTAAELSLPSPAELRQALEWLAARRAR